MTLITCDIGDVVILRGTLKDEEGTPVAVAEVSARAMLNGVETALPAVTHEGAGVYAVRFEPDEAGAWAVRMESASPAKAAEEDVVQVRSTAFIV